MSKSVPHTCKRCRDEGSYTGSLKFDGDPVPVCKNHGKEPHQFVQMEPAKKEKK